MLFDMITVRPGIGEFEGPGLKNVFARAEGELFEASRKGRSDWSRIRLGQSINSNTKG